jgi:hypothetical protein
MRYITTYPMGLMEAVDHEIILVMAPRSSNLAPGRRMERHDSAKVQSLQKSLQKSLQNTSSVSFKTQTGFSLTGEEVRIQLMKNECMSYLEYRKRKPEKRAKYNNIKVKLDGYLFDSQAEANRYCELKLLIRSGDVTKIEVHPKFLLQEGYVKDGRRVRPIYYEADFRVTYADGHIEIEDVKSTATRTKTYMMKRKMFEKRYPDITIKEVY